MNTLFNIYLISSLLSVILFPGTWNENFTAYANSRVEGKKYLRKDYCTGALIFSFTPFLNTLFAFYALIERLLYRKWKRDNGI